MVGYCLKRPPLFLEMVTSRSFNLSLIHICLSLFGTVGPLPPLPPSCSEAVLMQLGLSLIHILLLKKHAYLAAYDRMSETEQTDIIRQTKTLEELTAREKEVLQHILSGKANREIAGALFISESTVKTHARNIFSKYDVGSRAELISTLLKNQSYS